MSGVFRPLFVLVEAVEAECRRLLEPSPPVPTKTGLSIPDCEDIMRRHFKDETLYLERSAADRTTHIGHRCKVCRKWHSVLLDDPEMHASTKNPGAVIADKIWELLERPCKVTDILEGRGVGESR